MSLEPSHPHVLLVEDTPLINQSLYRALRTHFTVDTCATLSGASQYILERTVPYDAVVLDRVLPDGDGLELLQLLQTESQHTRICVMTEQSSLTQQVAALKSQVDTYLHKPLTPQQVVAHVMALLRRGKIISQQCSHWFDTLYYPHERRVQRETRSIRLSERESQFLGVFFRSSAGQATHEQLRSVLWDTGIDPSPGVLHVTIQRLRRRLRPLEIYIDGLYGLGYQLRLGTGTLQ